MKNYIIFSLSLLLHASLLGQSTPPSNGDTEKKQPAKIRFEANVALHLPAFSREVRERKLGVGFGGAVLYDTQRAIKPLLGIDLNNTRYVGFSTLDTTSKIVTTPLRTSLVHLGIPLGLRYVVKRDNAVFFDLGLMTDILLSNQTDASVGVYQSDNFVRKDISPTITNPIYVGFYAGIGLNKCYGK
ncbi:MAG: hypothetical protein RLZZ262_1805 [Bacteroidota bacterium]